MWSDIGVIWQTWLHDGLRSIGLLIPIASVMLLIRAWWKSPPQMQGTWWGLALCAAALVAARVNGSNPFLFGSSSGVVVHPFSLGVLLFIFVSGVVLLFASSKAWRDALFPIALLLCVNPVPHAITQTIDLPLQYIGAHTANAFASWLKTPLEGSELRLMFSPALGMFIAPGCNGLRGALAMGYLTLILGYLYRLPWRIWTIYISAGILIAYLLNLVRLCGLVLFYKLALAVPFLARHMEALDYLLGTLIFFSAAFFVLRIPRQWARRQIPQS